MQKSDVFDIDSQNNKSKEDQIYKRKIQHLSIGCINFSNRNEQFGGF